MQKPSSEDIRKSIVDQTPFYLDERKVSKITGRALSTLRNDRHLRRGIPYIKCGRQVKYSLADVIQFMESRKVVF